MVGHAILDCCKTPDQSLACRTAILVLLWVVDEIGLVEPAVGLGIGRLRFRYQGMDPGFMAGQDFLAVEITTVSDCGKSRGADRSAGFLGHVGQLVAIAAVIRHVVLNDQMMLGVDRGLHVVADDATATRHH